MTAYRLALAIGLVACRPEDRASVAPVGPGRAPFVAAESLGRTTHHGLPQALRTAHPVRPPAVADLDPMASLGADLTGGVLDPDRGATLVAALEGEPAEDVAEFGAGTFTWLELFGGGAVDGGGLCEDPHVSFPFEDGGVSYEASINLYSWLHMTSEVHALFMTPSDACVAAVDDDGVLAAVRADACTAEEEHGFFPSGSDCRACVDADGFDACVAAERCDDEVPAVWQFAGDWYEWAEAEVIACAPDIRGKVYFAGRDLPSDGAVPGPWDHFAWGAVCFALRGEDGEMGFNCLGEDDGTERVANTYGRGVISHLDWMRRDGGPDEHVSRIMYAHSIELEDGARIHGMLLSFGGIGQISTPNLIGDGNGDGVIDDDDWGIVGEGGWGFTPSELRPGGDDPSDPSDTWARDWLASATLKMSTTRDGVPINTINSTRCEEWAGPHDDTSYTCLRAGKPQIPWFVDNHVFWWNDTQVTIQSMVTLGSTGLPDPLVPGGFVPHVAGTAALANPDWDNCTWPHQLVPDHMRTEDVPLDWGGQASLDADTYLFGKDPEQDIRVIFATPQERGFCPER